MQPPRRTRQVLREFCKTVTPVLDSSVRSECNFIPCRTYPYPTGHKFGNLEISSPLTVLRRIAEGKRDEKQTRTQLCANTMMYRSTVPEYFKHMLFCRLRVLYTIFFPPGYNPYATGSEHSVSLPYRYQTVLRSVRNVYPHPEYGNIVVDIPGGGEGFLYISIPYPTGSARNLIPY